MRPVKSPTRDAVIELIQAQAAGGGPASVQQIAALEIALGLWGRAFASATVTPDGLIGDAVSPGVLELIGRELIGRGEAVFLIDVQEGRLMLHPASSWDVRGGPDPATWTYEVTRAGPSRAYTRKNVPASGVVHVRYAVGPSQPWRGVGPPGPGQHVGEAGRERRDSPERRARPVGGRHTASPGREEQSSASERPPHHRGQDRPRGIDGVRLG